VVCRVLLKYKKQIWQLWRGSPRFKFASAIRHVKVGYEENRAGTRSECKSAFQTQRLDEQPVDVL